jgi:hypothetical protein
MWNMNANLTSTMRQVIATCHEQGQEIGCNNDNLSDSSVSKIPFSNFAKAQLLHLIFIFGAIQHGLFLKQLTNHSPDKRTVDF